MKMAAFPLLILLSSCSERAGDPTADMTLPQKESYAAIERFSACMKPVVASAKSAKNLGDAELAKLGFQCPRELEDVVEKLSARDDYRADEPEFASLPLEARRAEIRRDFAGFYTCKLRDCQVTD